LADERTACILGDALPAQAMLPLQLLADSGDRAERSPFVFRPPCMTPFAVSQTSLPITGGCTSSTASPKPQEYFVLS
jgi:hypothetical protein